MKLDRILSFMRESEKMRQLPENMIEELKKWTPDTEKAFLQALEKSDFSVARYGVFFLTDQKTEGTAEGFLSAVRKQSDIPGWKKVVRDNTAYILLCTADVQLLDNAVKAAGLSDDVRTGAIRARLCVEMEKASPQSGMDGIIAMLLQEKPVLALEAVDAVCSLRRYDMIPEVQCTFDRLENDGLSIQARIAFADKMFSSAPDWPEGCEREIDCMQRLRLCCETIDRTPTMDQIDDVIGNAGIKMLRKYGLTEVQELGRNEPCPCGSGKKYKKCCQPAVTEFRGWMEPLDQQGVWLENYPDEDRVFSSTYNSECIIIDRLVYLALRKRETPFERKKVQITNSRKIGYLAAAYRKLREKLSRDGIESAVEYDKIGMIHFRTDRWLQEFEKLLRTAGNAVQADAVAEFRAGLQ